MQDLKTLSTILHLLQWHNQTENGSDALDELELELSSNYNGQISNFCEDNPDHPIAHHYADVNIADTELIDEMDMVAQRLNNKYLSMRKDKAEPDDEYFNLFDQMVEVTKRFMSVVGYTHPIQLTDKNIADPSVVTELVRNLSDISIKFINEKPQNSLVSKRQYTMDDVHSVLTDDTISYKVSNKNGSFMMPLDAESSNIHIKDTGNINDMMRSACHEFGHAQYQSKILANNTDIGKIGGMISLSLHESSSILHEINLSEMSPEVTEDYDNVFRLMSDKIHYIIHIQIRMEIEEMLFNNEITARDIPDVWNSKVEEYIGIVPKNNWDGFLQDIHWNNGAFGYFHSYAIGFFNALVMSETMVQNGVDTSNPDNLLKEIENTYGEYNEFTKNILERMYPDLGSAIEKYEEQLFKRFTYVG